MGLLLLMALVTSCNNSAPSTTQLHQEDTLQIVEEITVDSVWAANRVWFDLHTVGDRQFIAYYDSERMMTVASRSVGSNTWQKKILSNQLRWDSHNSVHLGIDEKGYIHVSGNMHVNPLAYYKSTIPFDVNSLVEVNRMIGKDESDVTYPRFFNSKDGQLLFSYRSGTSGRGNILVNRFIAEEQKWERYLSDPLFEGSSEKDNRSAYHSFIKDSSGNFHYVWMWRWTPLVETSHQICYATTPDLIHWKNAAGESVSLPFRPDNETLIVDNTPSKGGMHNGKYKIIITPQKKPLIAYLKYDENGKTQLYLAYFSQGSWRSNKVSNWDFRWDFIGGGDNMSMGASFDLTGFSDDQYLAIDWKLEDGKSGRYVIDIESLENVDREIEVLPLYPASVYDKISNNPALSVQVVNSDGIPSERGVKYLLKWEAMKPSHGSSAPDIIPAGPISPLKLLKIQKRTGAIE